MSVSTEKLAASCPGTAVLEVKAPTKPARMGTQQKWRLQPLVTRLLGKRAPGQVARPVLLSFRQLGEEQEPRGKGDQEAGGKGSQGPGSRRQGAKPVLLSFRQLEEERVEPLTRRATVGSKQSCKENSSSLQDKSNRTQSNTSTLEVGELEQIIKIQEQKERLGAGAGEVQGNRRTPDTGNSCKLQQARQEQEITKARVGGEEGSRSSTSTWDSWKLQQAKREQERLEQELVAPLLVRRSNSKEATTVTTQDSGSPQKLLYGSTLEQE